MRISSNNSFCFQNKNVSHTETDDALHEEANAGKILKVKSLWCSVWDDDYVDDDYKIFFSGYQEQWW